ncbi:MAG: hypothetical protein PVI30_14185 [Myxococcales bacterium]
MPERRKPGQAVPPPGPPPDAPFADSWRRAIDAALQGDDQSGLLLPLVYARRNNDARLARALLEFAREHAESIDEPDAALGVLELADAALAGRVDKTLCQALAGNLLDEAYARVHEDKRLDRFFGVQCASSAARLASRVQDPESLQDAIEVVRAAVAMTRSRVPAADAAARTRAGDAVVRVRRRASERIRRALDAD